MVKQKQSRTYQGDKGRYSKALDAANKELLQMRETYRATLIASVEGLVSSIEKASAKLENIGTHDQKEEWSHLMRYVEYYRESQLAGDEEMTLACAFHVGISLGHMWNIHKTNPTLKKLRQMADVMQSARKDGLIKATEARRRKYAPLREQSIQRMCNVVPQSKSKRKAAECVQKEFLYLQDPPSVRAIEKWYLEYERECAPA